MQPRMMLINSVDVFALLTRRQAHLERAHRRTTPLGPESKASAHLEHSPSHRGTSIAYAAASSTNI